MATDNKSHLRSWIHHCSYVTRVLGNSLRKASRRAVAASAIPRTLSPWRPTPPYIGGGVSTDESLYDAASHSDLFSFGHDGDYEYSGAHALGLAAAQIPREDVFAGRVSTRPAHDDGHVYSPTDTCHDSSSSLRYGASTSGHGHSDTCRQPYANLHRDGAPSLSIHCSDRSARREHEPTEVFKRNCPVTRVTQLSGHDVQYELALGQQTPHSCRLSGSASCQHPGDTYDNVPGEGPQDIYTGGDLDIDANFPLALACARQALDVGSDKETEHLLEAFIASQSRVLKVISPLPHINGTHLREVIQIAMRLRESDSTPSPIVYTARPSSRFPPSHLQAFSMPLQVDKGAKIFLLYATHDQLISRC
ncbi:hypothetical protein BC835DRAFT_401591 [Cytidiella melzeri]|nr:hypothetical protein BC835DRAFT_401591 [Cytidiella melzeri]